jgi:1,5-anhydro-D-fructose reductase (1,5-anhydro-D-mannitol-forming)
MNPIRFGIIGCGRFAQKTIAPAIQNTPGASLVAVQRRSLDAARQAAAACGAPLACATPAELVRSDTVDAVFIVSANSAHCPEALAAAGAGKHVLLEKPMALNVDEAERIIMACRTHGVKLMVGHMVRLSPVVRRIREMVLGGDLGEVTFVRADFMYDGSTSTRNWLMDRRVAGGGPVFDIGVHCLDTLRYVLDDEVTGLRCRMYPRPTPTRTESTAQLALEFTRGTLGGVYCSYTSGVRRSFIEVIGTRGMVSAIDFTVSPRITELVWTRERPDGPPIVNTERIEVPNLYVEEIKEFLAALREGKEIELTGENGLTNQRLLDEAYRQAAG